MRKIRIAPRHQPRRLGALAAVATALALGATLTAPAHAAPAATVARPSTDNGTSSLPRLARPFTRERVVPGAVDADPYHIAHVYEVQYRLKRLGLFPATPNGRYGPITTRGVKRFQRQLGLQPTGVVNARTWTPLIRRSVRGQVDVPAACKTGGWHACYDRSRHQVNLYHGGKLYNSWFVRGGSSTTQTRTGDYQVYWRDIDHTSSRFGDAPMPYSQFFDGGQALHGSRLMMDPWVGHSHGCVNFWTEDARQLWLTTSQRRLFVHVYGDWD